MTPEFQNFNLAKINGDKTQNFQFAQKAGIHFIKLYDSNSRKQFQVIILFFFAMHWSNKTVKGNDVTFPNATLAFLTALRQTK